MFVKLLVYWEINAISCLHCEYMFFCRTKRNDFLSKAKKLKLDAKTLIEFHSTSRVNVNEHLICFGEQLLGATVQKKRNYDRNLCGQGKAKCLREKMKTFWC